MIELFPSGEYNYKDQNIELPILITSNDLEAIASKTNEVLVYDGHDTGVKLGALTNFTVKDGSLYADAPTGFDIDNYGLSPTFVGDLVRDGDKYHYDNITMESVARTKTPRTGIIYNMKFTNSRGDNMDYEKLIEKKDEQIMNQQEEIAILKKQLSETKKVAKGKEKVDEELNQYKAKVDELEAEVKEYKADAKSYRDYRQNKKEEIITEFVGDDEEGKTKLQDLPLETLEYMQEKRVLDIDKKTTIDSNPAGNDGNPDDGNPVKSEPKPYDQMTAEELDAVFAGKI